MPITPIDLETLSEDEMILLAEVQAAVDAELRQLYAPGHTVSVGNAIISALDSANPRVKAALLASYSASWDIAEYIDSRGFGWLSFSQKV